MSFISSQRLFELDVFAFQITSNNKNQLCQSPKTGITAKIKEIFRKSNTLALENVIRKEHAKFIDPEDLMCYKS